MPLPDGRLLTEDCAALVGIKPSDWRARVSRGYAPEADAYVKHDGSPRPVWNTESMDAYLIGRSLLYRDAKTGTWCAAAEVTAGSAAAYARILDRLNGATA